MKPFALNIQPIGTKVLIEFAPLKIIKYNVHPMTQKTKRIGLFDLFNYGKEHGVGSLVTKIDSVCLNRHINVKTGFFTKNLRCVIKRRL